MKNWWSNLIDSCEFLCMAHQSCTAWQSTIKTQKCCVVYFKGLFNTLQHCISLLLWSCIFIIALSIHPGRGGGGGGVDSTLIRRVCATGVLNLSPRSGVGKPKKDTLFWSYHSFLKSVVLYYWRQRSCLCFIYLIKWFYHSILVLSCLCKRVLNFILLLSVYSYDICSAF